MSFDAAQSQDLSGILWFCIGKVCRPVLYSGLFWLQTSR